MDPIRGEESSSLSSDGEFCIPRTFFTCELPLPQGVGFIRRSSVLSGHRGRHSLPKQTLQMTTRGASSTRSDWEGDRSARNPLHCGGFVAKGFAIGPSDGKPGPHTQRRESSAIRCLASCGYGTSVPGHHAGQWRGDAPPTQSAVAWSSRPGNPC
jgi:hypothetical protein